MRAFTSFVLAAALTLPSFSFAQGDQDVVLKTTTRLVQVSVIVKDKDGRPVSGLKRDDFSLTDGGKDQQIQLFSVETSAAPSGKNAPVLPAGMLTNRPAGYGGVPRNLTTILIDSLNTKPADWVYAFQNIQKFLGQLEPTDHVALFTFGSKLIRVSNYTNDSAALLAALKTVKVGGGTGISSESASEPDVATHGPGDPFAATLAQMQQSVNDITQTMAQFAGMVRAQESLRALEAVVSTLSGVPGRKNLIWVCGDFPLRIAYADAGIDPRYRNIKDDMDKTARAINIANVAIYPVDARGLLGVADAGADVGGAGSGRTPGRASRGSGINPTGGDGLAERINSASTTGDMEMHAAMNDLADRTGGRAFYNTNNIFGAIRASADDSKVTYTLAYSPNHNQWNGNFRELKIKVNRPGVTALYRKGYLAVPDLPSDAQTRRVALGHAAASPFIETGIGLKIRPVRQEQVLQMNIEIDMHEIGFEQKDGKYNALVDLFFVLRDRAGKELNQIHQPADLSLSSEDYKRLEPTGIGLSLPLPIASGTATIRVVARDNASGQVGSLDVPVTP